MSEQIPETLWDLQKAQTLASVIRETRVLKTALGIRDHNRMVRARELGLGDPYADDEFVGIDLAEYDTQEQKAEDQAMINGRVDAGIALYEAAYALSPNVFATLPTDEFMDVAQRINGLRMKIARRRSEAGPVSLNVNDLALFTTMAIGHVENRREYESSPYALEKAFNQPAPTEGISGPNASFKAELNKTALAAISLQEKDGVRVYAEFVAKQMAAGDGTSEELEQQLAELLSQYGAGGEQDV